MQPLEMRKKNLQKRMDIQTILLTGDLKKLVYNLELIIFKLSFCFNRDVEKYKVQAKRLGKQYSSRF